MPQCDDIGFLLRLISDSIEKKINQHLKQFDLTFSQTRILGYLHEREGVKTSQKDIEEYFEVTHPTVIGILNRLESKGFITSEYDTEDKRVKNVYLTEKEFSVFRDMRNFGKQTEQKLLQGLTDAQIKELRQLLKIVYGNIWI